MLKASAGFRPTVQGYKVVVGTRIHCVIQEIKVKVDNPQSVESLDQVELLGQAGVLYRHAAMPPADALGGICLATTGLPVGVPKDCLTRAAQPWALEDLEKRRVNLTSMTEGVQLYTACIPQVKAQHEAARAAKRRKLDLERRAQGQTLSGGRRDLASASTGGDDGEVSGGSGEAPSLECREEPSQGQVLLAAERRPVWDPPPRRYLAGWSKESTPSRISSTGRTKNAHA